MPGMQLHIKKSEDDIKRLFFDPNLKKASTTRGHGIANENASHEWTDVAELRLFSKDVPFKPAGVNRHFNLGQLVNYMSNIYEDEEYTDFAVFLTPDDYKLYRKGSDIPNKQDIIIFKPVYKIRPTPDMIMDKLSEFYDMKTVENHEYLPDDFMKKFEFNVDVVDRPSSMISTKDPDSTKTTPIPPKKGDLSDYDYRSESPCVSSIARKKKALQKEDNSRTTSPSTSKKHQ